MAPTVDADGAHSGMNGIAVTPDNRWLIVARGTPSQLLRISLTNPSDVRVIALSGDTFGLMSLNGASVPMGPDGIVFSCGELYVVFGAGVQRVRFHDRNFSRGSVRTSSTPALGLSTATQAFGEVYVIDSEIHVLSPALGLPVVLPHSILRVADDSFGR